MTRIPIPPAENVERLGFAPRDLARFIAKIDLSAECWTWTGANNGAGYGQFHFSDQSGKRTHYAHRMAYELWVGPIPGGMTLDHRCGRGHLGCLTPYHLDPMPIRANILRGNGPLAKKARQTHCKRGHPLSGDNLILRREGRSRICRICRDMHNAARDPVAGRIYAKAYYHAHKKNRAA